MRMVMIGLWLFALVLVAVGEARAGCNVVVKRRAASTRVARQVVMKQQAVAIVPFAVPVAVPVAVVARPAVFYGLSPYAVSGTGAAADETPQVAAPAAAHPAASEAKSLVARSCISCHGGTAPKAGLDLSDLGALTPQQRLAAVARVVSDDAALRMPPDRALAPGEIGAVLQELAGSNDQ
jgi:mono/diheme cytochrome c family protein